MKKFKCGLYYGVMILLFLVVEPIIGYLRFSDKVSVENNVLELSNNDLKQKLEELYKLRDKAKELQKDLQSDELSLEELDEIKAGFRR